jgi:hypothetical protein
VTIQLKAIFSLVVSSNPVIALTDILAAVQIPAANASRFMVVVSLDGPAIILDVDMSATGFDCIWPVAIFMLVYLTD